MMLCFCSVVVSFPSPMQGETALRLKPSFRSRSGVDFGMALVTTVYDCGEEIHWPNIGFERSLTYSAGDISDISVNR